MARAGTTQRKTDNVHRLKGTAQKCRHGTPDEKPQAPAGKPTCPAWMHQYAKTEWKRIVPLLEEMGILSKTDQTILTQYCTLFADFKLATMGKRMKTVVLKSNGDVELVEVPEPFTAAEHTQLRQCAQQLGLTVLARQSIKLPKGQKANRFAGL